MVLTGSSTYTGGVGVPTTYNDVIGGATSANMNYEFNGLIDDVRVYNRALSAAEIQALYNAEK